MAQFSNQPFGRNMWDRYEHRERRIRRTDIVAVWAIAAALLVAVAVLSTL